MSREDKIRKIMANATEEILAVLNDDTDNSVAVSIASANLDATVNKILKNTFATKTLLVDENNIDEVRYGMLDYIPDESIIELYKSCMNWYTTSELEENSQYGRFCSDMSKMLSTNVEDELTNNVNTIIFKYKQINGGDTRLIN